MNCYKSEFLRNFYVDIAGLSSAMGLESQCSGRIAIFQALYTKISCKR